MRVLALIEAAGHVCFRYRLHAFAGALREAGFALEAQPLSAGAYGRVMQFRAARSYDVVILQRKLLRLWQLQLLRRWSKLLVYDFDDAVFLHDSYSQKGSASRSRLRHFREVAAAADAIIAGNDYLRTQALRYAETSRVVTIPTCVEPHKYPMASHERRGPAVQLVWIGQQSTLHSLTGAQAILAGIAQRLPGITLRVISNAFPQDCGMTIVPRYWRAATEAFELAQTDIGVAWLPDDDWSRGKCGLKVLQYMAAGLPVVADPIGVHREMIVDGETGFFATTVQEWVDRIELLATVPELRRQMGEKARQRVARRYSLEQWSGQIVDLLRTLTGTSASHPKLAATKFSPDPTGERTHELAA